MTNRIIKRITLLAVFIGMAAFWSSAQDEQNAQLDSILQVLLPEGAYDPLTCEWSQSYKIAAIITSDEAYDPLIPQAFVFDKAHNLFGAINTVENTIDIIKMENDTLKKVREVVVDNYEGRHDVHLIYRPQGIAIYDGYLVYMASHRDSCYISVLNLQDNLTGEEVNRFYYKGNATAFSYNKEAQQMYIAGQNSLGYDLIILSTKEGIENMTEDAALHYQKPKKADVIRQSDPWGIGIMAIAMSTVFMALLMLVLVFSNTDRVLKVIQKGFSRRKTEAELLQQAMAPVREPSEISGEEFAAIAAAIYLYNSELHDKENTILTIAQSKRPWTPWNAKYFSMNNYFMKRNR